MPKAGRRVACVAGAGTASHAWHPRYPPAFDSRAPADRLWPVLTPLMRGHAAVYRASGGLVGGSVPGLPPMLLLDHVGARSGKQRTTPLVYMRDRDDLLVVA